MNDFYEVTIDDGMGRSLSRGSRSRLTGYIALGYLRRCVFLHSVDGLGG